MRGVPSRLSLPEQVQASRVVDSSLPTLSSANPTKKSQPGESLDFQFAKQVGAQTPLKTSSRSFTLYHLQTFRTTCRDRMEQHTSEFLRVIRHRNCSTLLPNLSTPGIHFSSSRSTDLTSTDSHASRTSQTVICIHLSHLGPD
jgi:hypothetical protein